MKIEVLGTGCSKCNKLYKLAEEVLAASGTEATLVKVEGLDEIMSYGVAFTPALVINGEVKAAGSLPKAQQIAAWLQEAQA
jgi:small redox-active disulfide protein 2